MTDVVSAQYQLKLHSNQCALCDVPIGDDLLYPQRLDEQALTPYAFSARRRRRFHHFRIVRCRKCGLVRSDPTLLAHDANLLYAESEFLYSDESTCAAKTYLTLLEYLLPRIDPRSKILEIGCGDAEFLYHLHQKGFTNLKGVDPSKVSVDAAKAPMKSKLFCKPFESGDFDSNSFSLLAAFHIIDHLHDPLGFLVDAVSLLKSGGHILITCHNCRALSARLLGERSPIFDVEHVFLFDRKTLRNLLNKAGLEVVQIANYVNTYPLGYWMKMLPFLSKFMDTLPLALRHLKLTLPAGNMYALARRQ